ncbi:MAG: alpha/beta hydrolase fold domain-containing protein, partial [Candidatus Methylacidiphilales bacterium]
MKLKTRSLFFACRGGIAIISAVTLLATVCLARDDEKTLVPTSAAPASASAPTAPVTPGQLKITQNIPYVTGGGERQMLDVYANPDPKAPLVIWIHGGGWVGGSKSPCPAVVLLNRGFSVASINYRFSKTAKFPAQIEDCKAAVRYLRAHARELGINGDIIGVAGASAGGHLVSLLGVTGNIKTFDVGENLDQSSAVQAVVNIVGPSDLARFDGYPNKGITKVVEDLIGGPLKANAEKAKAGSPITYITKDAPPFINLYGK